jgi:hypothetical protein
VATFTAKAISMMMERLEKMSDADADKIFETIYPPLLEKKVTDEKGKVLETIKAVNIDQELFDINDIRVFSRSKNEPDFITSFIISLKRSGAKNPSVVTIYSVKNKQAFYKKGERHEHIFRFDDIGGRMGMFSFKMFSAGDDHPEYDFAMGVGSRSARVVDTTNSLNIKIEYDQGTDSLHIDEFNITGIGSFGQTQIENLRKEAERKILNAFQRVKYNIDLLDKTGL